MRPRTRALPFARTHFGVTASAGQRCGDVEMRTLRDAAGNRRQALDLSMTHHRYRVTTPSSMPCSRIRSTSTRVAARGKMNAFRQPHADNQNISFLPACFVARQTYGLNPTCETKGGGGWCCSILKTRRAIFCVFFFTIGAPSRRTREALVLSLVSIHPIER